VRRVDRRPCRSTHRYADREQRGRRGEEVVLSTFHPARKIAALRARPDVALTVDAATTPPQALLIRGRAEVTDVEGIAARTDPAPGCGGRG
jgi:hypothetical protein